MSVFLRSGLLAASLAAAECTVVVTTGDLNSFVVFGLTSGEKLLIISGADVSADPAHPRPCVSTGAFVGGKVIYTRVILAPQGDAWIGRSIATADGDLLVTLRSAGTSGGKHLVAGTFSGHAVSVLGTPASKPSGARVVFDSLSVQAIDGGGDTLGQFASGNIAGSVTFIDATGNAAKCDWVQWTLQPLPPG
jgi:hypothetical protein